MFNSIRAVFAKSMGVALLASVLVGCQTNANVNPNDPQIAAFLDLVTPRSIEVQKHLTRAADFDGDGVIDGIEVVLTANDKFDDPVKCLGTFHFELNELRLASGDKVGRRLAFWPMEVLTDHAVSQTWDRLLRFYRFQLDFNGLKLAPGRYILSARLVTPTGKVLYDEYLFPYETATR